MKNKTNRNLEGRSFGQAERLVRLPQKQRTDKLLTVQMLKKCKEWVLEMAKENPKMLTDCNALIKARMDSSGETEFLKSAFALCKEANIDDLTDLWLMGTAIILIEEEPFGRWDAAT